MRYLVFYYHRLNNVPLRLYLLRNALSEPFVICFRTEIDQLWSFYETRNKRVGVVANVNVLVLCKVMVEGLLKRRSKETFETERRYV